MSSWFGTGWDDLDDFESKTGDSSGGGGSFDGPRTPKRFWMPEGSEKRVLFLDEDPFMFHEHNFQKDGHWRNWEVCPRKNGLADQCQKCDDEMWPYYVGYFTVIDLTPYEFVAKSGPDRGKNIRVEWGKRLYGAKYGSKRKPGTLQRLRRLSDRKGGLTGTIWLIPREGDMTPNVGSDFDFDGRIERSEGQTWEDAIREWAEANKGVTAEQWEKSPWVPLDYGEIFSPEGPSREQEPPRSATQDEVRQDDVPF